VAVATLVIPVLGLVQSVASLTWQAATFVLSGSRVRADLKHGAANAAGFLTGAPGVYRSVDDQGLGDEVIGVKVRNVGRLAASVDSIEVAMAGGMRMQMPSEVMGQSLPHRLEPQSSASWFVPAEPIQRVIRANAQVLKRSDPCEVWIEVEVVGKTVRTRQAMRLGSRPELGR
jgi:hypothetical protein